jgi:O-antigen ligase
MAAGLAAFLVLPFGLVDGGYVGRSYVAMTAALAATAALAGLSARRGRVSRPFLATGVALALLAAWVALSASWAANGVAVTLETKRSVLYAVAFLAAGLTVGAVARSAFLTVLAGAIGVVGAAAVAMRVASGVPDHPYYGSLLGEPVGYPNTLGVLAAIGTVLAVGLAAGVSGHVARALRALAPLLVLVLGLTGSRGGALALAIGLVVLLGIVGSHVRWSCIGTGATALALGGGSWVVTTVAWDGRGALAVAAAGVAALGAAAPRLDRPRASQLACALAIAAVAVLAVHRPATTSSLRTDYWRAALAEVRDRPLLGSGAGTFFLTWQERRRVDADVRDAHSLYVETLSELGPVGLALVLAVVVVPLVAAWRRRGDRHVAAAAAGFAVFVVHAGVDWDWEMPAVTLVALACAAVAATSAQPTTRTEGGGDVRQPD